MARSRRVWLKQGGRRSKVALDAPFFEAGAEPADPAYRAPTPEEEAESLARWQATQRRQIDRVAPTAGELSTVATFAAALLALMTMERVSLLDGSGAERELVADVEGGGRVEQFVAQLSAELTGEDEGLSWSPGAAGSQMADAGVGASIIGPFRDLPGPFGRGEALVVEDRLDGMPPRAGTAGYLAGTAAPDAAPVGSAASSPVAAREAQLATALPIEAGAGATLIDAPSTTERARQVEVERPGANAPAGESPAPVPATAESAWTQLTWSWQPAAPPSPSARPDHGGSTQTTPVASPGNNQPESAPAPGRTDEPLTPPVLATGPEQHTPQDAPGNSENAPGRGTLLPPGQASPQDGHGNSGNGPLLAEVPPPGIGKQEGGPGNSENAPGLGTLFPPGQTNQQDGPGNSGHAPVLAELLPPGLGKQEGGPGNSENAPGQLASVVPPGLGKQEGGSGNSENAPGQLASALPPGLAKQEGSPGNSENAPGQLASVVPPGHSEKLGVSEALPPLLAALPTALEKLLGSTETGTSVLAALPPGLAKQAEAEPGASAHPGRGASPHGEDFAFVPPGHAQGGPEETGPHAPVDPLPEPPLFAALPAALDAIL